MKLEFPPGRLRPIGAHELDTVRAQAAASPRRRAIVRYHEHEESVQRMINAVEPDSYVRPHKHEGPDKVEVFLALRGRACICIFDDGGTLVESLEISAVGPSHGAEIPPRLWHSLLALEPGTILYEVLDGPFTSNTHKSFASWAPEEGTPEGEKFLSELRQRLAIA